MATTLTRNLKLRVNSNLTADAKYNLARLDLLGSTFLVDTTDDLNIRSQADISIEPESADIGGSGVGGSVSFGSADHLLSSVSIFSSLLQTSSPLSIKDQATGGSQYLALSYKSDLEGLADTLAGRTLSFDVQGGDRSLVLGGSLALLGGWSLTMNVTGDSSLTLPSSGTLATLSGTETLTGKTIDGSVNTITNIDASNISPAFGAQVISTSESLRFTETYNTDLRAAQSGQMEDLVFSLPSSSGINNQVLTTDGSGNLSWTTPSGSGTVVSYSTSWSSLDGLQKTVTHSLGSTDIDVTLVDLDDNTVHLVNEIEVIDINTIQLTSSEAPSNSWKVVIQA